MAFQNESRGLLMPVPPSVSQVAVTDLPYALSLFLRNLLPLSLTHGKNSSPFARDLALTFLETCVPEMGGHPGILLGLWLPLALPPTLPPSLPPPLSPCLSPSLPPSLRPSIPPSLRPSVPPSLPPSLPPALPPYLPCFHTASHIPCLSAVACLLPSVQIRLPASPSLRGAAGPSEAEAAAG